MAAPMTADPLWIAEAEVVSLIDMDDAIAVLERALAMEARGAAANMLKTHVSWNGDTLHAIGATFLDDSLVGTKTWAHTRHGATPLLILFDSHDGSLRAIIEAFALGQLRTGGISGLATRWLSAPDADDMALVGAGKQAMAQLAGVAAVRDLRRVRVFSRSPKNSGAFARSAQSELGLTIGAVTSAAAAAEGASLITLVTRATEPILASAMVARGAHINAVGAITPDRIEFEPALLARCDLIVADSVAQVRTLSREFREFCGENEASWHRVIPLSEVVARGGPRPGSADLTLFKAMGMGICDVALGAEVLKRAIDRSAGRRFTHPQRAAPRLCGTSQRRNS